MALQVNPPVDAPAATGSVLVMAGGVFALQQAGFLQFLDLSRTWPLFLIVLAIIRLGATMNEADQRGWTLLLLGDCLLACTMSGWAYAAFAWPLLLTVIGALMIFRAITHRHEGQGRDDMQADHYAR
jgi:hypothetical protein